MTEPAATTASSALPSAAGPSVAASSTARPGVHQFLARDGAQVLDEALYADRIVRFVYSTARERAPWLFRMLTGRRMSSMLGTLNFDLPLAPRLIGCRSFLTRAGVDPAECVLPPSALDTPRKIFERQIRYATCRPLPADPRAVVSPADARLMLGSLAPDDPLWLKGKFFGLDELLSDRGGWVDAFRGGTAMIFRLTPDKYHYNHVPVDGVVRDIYTVEGAYHACNPSAIVALATPFSKNRRVVTVIDTDVEGGTGIGLVAMVEVVALMIGQIVQCYSASGYDDPQDVTPGLVVRRGQPKSLYRPGSSTDVLLFEPGRIAVRDDLRALRQRGLAVQSRFSRAFDGIFVEREVQVREGLAAPSPSSSSEDLP
ncbi:MAG: phosphatidylserine decarboxylase [Acidobacteriota bacterium]